MKKILSLVLFSVFVIITPVLAAPPENSSGETPPIIPGGDMNPPVLPDNGAEGEGHTEIESEGPVVPNNYPSTTGSSTIPPDEQLPGMPGGGTQNTGALNSGPGTDSTSGAASPQSGSSQLAKCSNIRFLSLLDILIWLKCIIVVAIIPLIFALAFMFFLWGVMRFIMTSDPTKRKEGKAFIVGGLIGLFVMTSIWGIIKIVSNTLGTGSAVPILQTSSLKKTP